MRASVFRVCRVLALVAVVPALAAGGGAPPKPPWVQLGPYGGWMSALAVLPGSPETWYVVAPGGIETPGDVFQSTDAGAGWHAVTLNGGCDPSSVAATPDGGGTLYIGCRQEVLRSTDGGVEWTVLPFPSGVMIHNLAVVPGRPDVVLALAGGLYVTRDGGTTWERVHGGRANDIAVAGTGDAARLLAGTEDGLLASDDLGRTWASGAAGLPTGQWERWVGTLAVGGPDRESVYAMTGAGIFRSRDGGTTWARAGDPPLNEGGSWAVIDGLAVDPADGERLYAVGSDGAFSSSDGGVHWSKAGADPPIPLELIAVSPALGNGLVATGDGVYRLGGANGRWKPADDGIPRERVLGVAVEPGEPWRVIARAGRVGLELSSDGGAHWTEAETYGGYVGGVVVWDPLLPHVAYAVGWDMWLSRDGGASWKRVAQGPPETVIDADIVPTSPRTLWAAGGPPYGGVWRSRDGGTSWKQVFAEDSHGGAYTVAVAPSDPKTVYAGTSDEHVIRSFDGGETWSAPLVPPDEPLVDLVIDRVDPQMAWGVTLSGTIVRTGDGWRTWEARANGLSGVRVRRLMADPTREDCLVAVADSGAFETSDGGLTWLRLGSPVGPEVETGAWDPLSGTVYLAPFARSIVAGTFGSQPLAAGVDAAFLPAARTVQLTAWVHGGAPPYAIVWDFQDGTGPAPGNPVEHVFPHGGTFTVHVTVTDHDGSLAEARTTVSVPDAGRPRPRRTTRRVPARRVSPPDGTSGVGGAFLRYDRRRGGPAGAPPRP